MGWYDWFAHVYDLQLEGLYRPWRRQLFDGLDLDPDARVLDIGCGTGQNLPFLADRIPDGEIVGVDLSSGMLGKAQAKIDAAGWNARLIHHDLMDLDSLDVGVFDVVVSTVVLTAVPDWRTVFASSFALLKPGGTYAILDVHASTRTLHTWMVERLALADLDRRVWTELEQADKFERQVLEASARTFGGDLFVATGRR